MISRQTTIFLHIPKTAGATLFFKPMTRQYKNDSIYNHGLLRKEDIDAFKSLPVEKRRAIRLLHGHLSFGIHSSLPNPARYVTILRRPIERVVSYYYYQKTLPAGRVHAGSEGLPLDEFVSSGVAALHTDNGQTRLVSGIADVPFGQCSRDMLDTAKRNLVEWFDVVGITEDFDRTLHLMKSKLLWSRPVFYPKRHVNTARPRDQISSELRDLIGRHNLLDLELYDFALDLYRRQLNSIGGIDDRRLQWFSAANSAYQRAYDIGRSGRRKARSLLHARPQPSKSGPR